MLCWLPITCSVCPCIQVHVAHVFLPAVQIAGHKTGFGNPTWLETHPVADVTSPAVAALLEAGAVVRDGRLSSMYAMAWQSLAQHSTHHIYTHQTRKLAMHFRGS
jgi:hypothetical protein